MTRARPDPSAAAPHYTGHRERLRARLMEAGADALQDYELLEILLFAAIPRRDVKPLAKQLLAEFQTIGALMQASPERLRQSGLGEAAAATMLAAHALALRGQKRAVLAQPVLSSWQKLLDYCRAAMGQETREQFRLLFLDVKNRLLRDEVQQQGTVDHTPVYPREVVRRALEVGASAVVLVHNHPSGDVQPSKADIAMTRAIVEACRTVGIVVHDHIIVGADQVLSFKGQGIL